MMKKVFPNQTCVVSTALFFVTVLIAAAWAKEKGAGTILVQPAAKEGAGAANAYPAVYLQSETAVFLPTPPEPDRLWSYVQRGLENAGGAVFRPLGAAFHRWGMMARTASADDGTSGERSSESQPVKAPGVKPAFPRSLSITLLVLLFSLLIGFLLEMLILKRKINARSRELSDANQNLEREIEDRRAAESALRRSEAKYRELVENINDIIFAVDPDGTLTYISPTVRSVGGHDPLEIEGRLFSDFVYDEDQPRLNEYFHRIKSGPAEPIECRFITKSGEVRWGRLSCRQVHTGDRFSGIQGVLTDITDRKWIEEILHDSEQKFRRIIEQSHDGIMIVDERGVIVEWNKGEERICGLGRDEAIGRYVWDVYQSMSPPEERGSEEYDTIKDGILSLLLGGNVPWLEQIHETRILRPDGALRTVQSMVFLIRTDKGNMIGSISRDVTEQKETEERVKVSLREKEILLREVHHRVKNNLQVITSILDMSGIEPENSAARNTLREARNKVYTMALIHSQLYEAERMDRIDMSRYIEELTSHIAEMYTPKGVRIRTAVRIDGIHLTMNQAIPCALILNELITNSYKHAFGEREEGVLTVSMHRKEGARILMEVRDDGKGMVRESPTEGLGLRLVKNIAQVQLDGSVELEYDNKGLAVRVSFKEAPENASLS